MLFTCGDYEPIIAKYFGNDRFTFSCESVSRVTDWSTNGDYCMKAIGVINTYPVYELADIDTTKDYKASIDINTDTSCYLQLVGRDGVNSVNTGDVSVQVPSGTTDTITVTIPSSKLVKNDNPATMIFMRIVFNEDGEFFTDNWSIEKTTQ